jgi:predicted dehydrogenase
VSQLRLGLIGLSEGNGHPYSWSAIFNGYDKEAMATCPFPAIPAYLGEREFPRDAIADAAVTHIWTQSPTESERIATAARIETIAVEPAAMIGEIDALLLARDDAESHFELAAPFLAAGLPIYVDKPLALSVPDARRLLAARCRPGQIFSCSALRYAPELAWSDEYRREYGRPLEVAGRTPKDWRTYGSHVVEPALQLLDVGGRPPKTLEGGPTETGASVVATWHGGLRADLRSLGPGSGEPISFEIVAERGEIRLEFSDSFTAFRLALEQFVGVVRGQAAPPSDPELLGAVRLIEAGNTL